MFTIGKYPGVVKSAIHSDETLVNREPAVSRRRRNH
jgi:hypothetical protein